MIVQWVAAAGAALSLWAATPALALSSRVLVSAKNGADNPGCGAPATPCRTLQFAHDETSAGGQISIMDPGDYIGLNPPLRITKAISIVNDGAGTALVTRGIDIAGLAAADVVQLRGLAIAGALGIPGISFRGAAGSMTIAKCVVSKNSSDGVRINPDLGGSLNFSLSDVVISNNQQGLVVHGQGSTTGVIDHVSSLYNADMGVIVGNGTHKVTIADSVVSNNGSMGATVQFCNCSVSMRGLVASNNGSNGLFVQGNPSTIVVRLANSAATGNTNGVFLGGSGLLVESYGDNDLRGNSAANVAGGSLTPVVNQ